MVALTTKKHLFEVTGRVNGEDPVSIFLLEDSIQEAIEAANEAVEDISIISCRQIDDNTKHVLWLFDRQSFQTAES